MIHDRDGRRLDYGTTDASRLFNDIPDQVFSWQIEKSTDVSNNEIRYVYDKFSSPNVAYLQRVTWGQGSAANRSVEFALNDPNDPSDGLRPDTPVSARAGFRQQIDRRVSSIEVGAISGASVATYELTYSQDPDSTRSQLATVQRKGSDGAVSLPPYTFSYSFREAGEGFRQTSEPGFVGTATTCPPLGGIFVSGTRRMLRSVADMNRDGLGDLFNVNVNSAGIPTGQPEVSLGTGSAFRPGPGTTCSGTSIRGTAWAEAPVPFVTADEAGRIEEMVLDIDGDGYLDYVSRFGGGINGFSSRIRLGSAAGFSPVVLPTSIDPPHSWTFGWVAGADAFETANRLWLRSASNLGLYSTDYSTTSAMADVTGDGRPDLLISTPALAPPSVPEPYYTFSADPTWSSWIGWAVFVNRGLKPLGSGGQFIDFGSAPIRWPAPENGVIEHSVGGVVDLVLADQNGDGLADRVRQGSTEYGYGAGFYPVEEIDAPYPGYLGGVSVHNPCTDADAIDINGDGFLDFVVGADSGGFSPLGVYFGTGHGFARTAVNFARSPSGFYNTLEGDGGCGIQQALRDINGDGRADYIANNVYVQELLTNHAGLKSEPLAGLLTKAVDPLGGTVEFAYKTAPQFQDAAGLPANPDMSLPKPVVVQIVQSDGRLDSFGNPVTPTIATKLSYSGGLYDSAEHEFRGFTTVVATQVEDGIDATRTSTTFRTDRVCATNSSEREFAHGATVLVRELLSYQEVFSGTPPSQWSRCLLSAIVVESVEGNETTKKVRRSSFDYGSPIDANYNPESLEEWGEWSAATNQNIVGDERITEYEYAEASSAFPAIVSRVDLETVKDNAANVYSKRRYCYSGSCADASNGLLVSVREFLTDYTADPLVIDVEKTTATIAYDAHGNVAQVTGAGTVDDANGLQTTIEYDDAYQTFPVTVSEGSDVPMPLRPLETTFAYTSRPLPRSVSRAGLRRRRAKRTCSGTTHSGA